MGEDDYAKLLESYEALQEEYNKLLMEKTPKFLGMNQKMLGMVLAFLIVIAILVTCQNGEELAEILNSLINNVPIPAP